MSYSKNINNDLYSLRIVFNIPGHVIDIRFDTKKECEKEIDKIIEHQDTVKKLKKENEDLKNMINYMPGGAGYQMAKDEFEKIKSV